MDDVTYHQIKPFPEDLIINMDGQPLQPPLRNLILKFHGEEDIVLSRKTVISFLKWVKLGEPVISEKK